MKDVKFSEEPANQESEQEESESDQIPKNPTRNTTTEKRKGPSKKSFFIEIHAEDPSVAKALKSLVDKLLSAEIAQVKKFHSLKQQIQRNDKEFNRLKAEYDSVKMEMLKSIDAYDSSDEE